MIPRLVIPLEYMKIGDKRYHHRTSGFEYKFNLNYKSVRQV